MLRDCLKQAQPPRPLKPLARRSLVARQLLMVTRSRFTVCAFASTASTRRKPRSLVAIKTASRFDAE